MLLPLLLFKLIQLVYKIHTGEINLSTTPDAALKKHAQSLTTTAFSVVEAVAQHPQLVLQNRAVLVDQVLPVLAAFIRQSEDGNLRMLSLKLFADIATFYLESEDNGDEYGGSDADDNATQLLRSHLLQV